MATAFVWQVGWLLQTVGQLSISIFIAWCTYTFLPVSGGDSEVGEEWGCLSFLFGFLQRLRMPSGSWWQKKSSAVKNVCFR